MPWTLPTIDWPVARRGGPRPLDKGATDAKDNAAGRTGAGPFRRLARLLMAWPLGSALLVGAEGVGAADLPEYRLKAAFLYNFAVYTDWPAGSDDTLTLCILGQDPFGAEIDGLDGRQVGPRRLMLRRLPDATTARNCHILFIAASAIGSASQLTHALQGHPVLTVADSPNAARAGVGINMLMKDAKVSFEVNLKAVQQGGLGLSSKLLRLAREVYQ
jgi:hypothetical protein